MARSELQGERFVILSEIPPVVIFTTDYTTYRSLDTDGVGGTSMECGTRCGLGRFPFFAMSTFPLAAEDETGSSRLPESADPPFPPVYPYFFSTDLVYGRENMNNVLTMTRGDTYTFSGTTELDGVALNLTGATIVMTAKWSVQDSTYVFQLLEGSGITVTDAAAGAITVVIPASATTGLPDTEVKLRYDIEVTTAANNVYTVARGDLVVQPDVTV
jgi:hypothetical protein